MNLDTIAQLLEEKGVGERAKNIFSGLMPQGVSGILLRDYFGGTRYDHNLPGFYKGAFMLIVRGPSYDVSKQVCELAVKALTIQGNTYVGEVLFKYMRPRILPFSFPPSPGQQWEFTVTMDACYVDAA